ncbi:replication protein A 32 kDa subunit-B-like [Engraulis encrasicolus]|uniref:replication protein A 32 kDa subunit-B-like n=1 Tax=Engraulis encrasicolus TaxID=184585 RepID=UPI002FD2454C
MSSDRAGQQAAGCQRRAGDPLSPSTGLSPMQDQVLQLIKSCADHQGLGLAALRCRFPPQNAASLWECLQFLISEGHIYTTTDDNHFKATYG